MVSYRHMYHFLIYKVNESICICWIDLKIDTKARTQTKCCLLWFIWQYYSSVCRNPIIFCDASNLGSKVAKAAMQLFEWYWLKLKKKRFLNKYSYCVFLLIFFGSKKKLKKQWIKKYREMVLYPSHSFLVVFIPVSVPRYLSVSSLLVLAND